MTQSNKFLNFVCQTNSLLTSITIRKQPAVVHTNTSNDTVLLVPNRHHLFKCPVTKCFVPSREGKQLDSLLMSLGLLMSSSPLTMWAYTDTTQWSAAWRSTLVPHPSLLTSSQSVRKTLNFTLVWFKLSTFHLHMIGIISANEPCLSLPWFTDTIVCTTVQPLSWKRAGNCGRKSVINHEWLENPSSHLQRKKKKNSLHACKLVRRFLRKLSGCDKDLQTNNSKAVIHNRKPEYKNGPLD